MLCNKSFGQKFRVVRFVYVDSRVGPPWPLWVEFIGVKSVDGVAEACPIWLSQDGYPLEEDMFYDLGSFPQFFEISCP